MKILQKVDSRCKIGRAYLITEFVGVPFPGQRISLYLVAITINHVILHNSLKLLISMFTIRHPTMQCYGSE